MIETHLLCLLLELIYMHTVSCLALELDANTVTELTRKAMSNRKQQLPMHTLMKTLCS